MMVRADLAYDILQALGPPVDGSGMPISVTAEMMAYADAVVTTLAAATFSHAINTVVGSAPPGGALIGGAAAAGILAGVSAATWEGILAAAFAGATTLGAEAGASTSYIQTNAKANFGSGTITGISTATPVAPGILQNGAGSGGHLALLVGSAWASAVLAALGTPGPLASAVYTAVASYILANADLSYAVGQVQGAFPAGGGLMTAGLATGGAIA